MDIRQLEYFQAVSRLRSVTKAADQLHVAQPSVTIALKKLEDELGVTLFDRSQKQKVLTSEGRIFLQRVDDILNRIHDAIAEMQDYQAQQKGSIRIGVPPTIGAFIFPTIFARFRKNHPYFELTVMEAGSLTIQHQLEQGGLDIGIILLSDRLSKLESVAFSTGQLLVCVHAEHHLAKNKVISFEELRHEPFIMLKEDSYNRQVILEQCSRHGFIPNIVFSSSQIETIIGLVRQGVGISFLPDLFSNKYHDVTFRPLQDPLLIQVGLTWNPDRYLSKAAKTFIDFMKTE